MLVDALVDPLVVVQESVLVVKFESGDYGKVELKIGGVVGSSYSSSVIKYVKYE